MGIIKTRIFRSIKTHSPTQADRELVQNTRISVDILLEFHICRVLIIMTDFMFVHRFGFWCAVLASSPLNKQAACKQHEQSRAEMNSTNETRFRSNVILYN